MKRFSNAGLWLVIMNLFALSLAAMPAPIELAPAYLRPGEQRTFEVTYVARVPEIPASTDSVDLWIPVPRSSAAQTIRSLSFTVSPQVNREEKYGNTIAHWTLHQPHGGDQVTMRFVCTRRELVTDLSALRDGASDPAPQFAVYREASRLAVVDDRIRELADQITSGEVDTVAKGRAIYDYVLAHMRYDKSKPGWGTGSTAYACDTGQGNCTDFHSLFNSLCRAEGIAAAFEIGLYLPYAETSDEPLGGYHCWTYFRVPGQTWVPVDCSEAAREPPRRSYFFGDHTPNRVTLSTGRDLDLVPRQHGPALNYFVNPYAEADGRPITATKTWSYRNLDREVRRL